MGGQPGDFDWTRYASARPGDGTYVRYGAPEDLQGMFGAGSPFSDFFSQIFSGAAAGSGTGGIRFQTRRQRGQDVEQPVEITLQEAYHGTKCVLQRDGQRFEVKIPAGAKTGTRVRIGGEGGAGSGGGPAGDFYLRVTVVPDPRLERRDDDLHTTVEADLYTLVLGGELRVPTMEGDVVLSIPAGTQNGRSFRLRGKGMPYLNQPDQHGDLYAKVDARLPVDLTPRQRELFEELRQSALSG
jgi:curved DNA-binding protein